MDAGPSHSQRSDNLYWFVGKLDGGLSLPPYATSAPPRS